MLATKPFDVLAQSRDRRIFIARVAAVLLHAAGAARLLGAQTILSGVSPRAAQMLVDLGEDMSNLSTAASLGDALKWSNG
jgi:rsbT co-antagonist protein RsbR